MYICIFGCFWMYNLNMPAFITHEMQCSSNVFIFIIIPIHYNFYCIVSCCTYLSFLAWKIWQIIISFNRSVPHAVYIATLLLFITPAYRPPITIDDWCALLAIRWFAICVGSATTPSVGSYSLWLKLVPPLRLPFEVFGLQNRIQT